MKQILEVIKRQLENNFSCSCEEYSFIQMQAEEALRKSLFALSHSANDWHQNITYKTFDIFNSVENTVFLYWLSRLCFRGGHESLAERIYYLNKMLNAVELFYAVELPDIWVCDHPVGSVMGKATYHNYFSFVQGCTVGNNHGVYPIIGEYVAMMADSKILGKSRIGNHCIIGANACVIDCDVPDYSIVFGQSPSLTIKTLERELEIWRL